MPTYQYACTECGQDLEAVQKFTDDPLTECPKCSGRLRKVFSAVGVVFKGSGFYRTDSRGKSSSGDAGSEAKSTAKSESGGSGGGGGEAKPAAKAESGSTKKSGGESAA